MAEISTSRLRLRRWRPEDFAPFAAINADPIAMEFFPRTSTTSESDAMATRVAARLEERGWGLWAVELTAKAPFIGFVGLQAPTFETHFTPCVEIGWRLGRAHWGFGYATEAARAVLAFGFGELELTEIVSMTAVANRRSQAVMQRLRMQRNPADDFDHPWVPVASPVRRHVLYRVRSPNVAPDHFTITVPVM